MWYIETDAEKGTKVVSAVENFLPHTSDSGEESVKIWRANYSSQLFLPFKYDDFKLIFNLAAKKREIPDFSYANHDNLKQWLRDNREKYATRHSFLPKIK